MGEYTRARDVVKAVVLIEEAVGEYGCGKPWKSDRCENPDHGRQDWTALRDPSGYGICTFAERRALSLMSGEGRAVVGRAIAEMERLAAASFVDEQSDTLRVLAEIISHQYGLIAEGGA